MEEQDVYGQYLIQKVIKDIEHYFLNCGYQHIIVNIWKQRRIYVALDHARIEFCYEMDQDFHIWAKEKLSRKDHHNAKKLIPFLYQRRNDLISTVCKGYFIGEIKDNERVFQQVETRII